jgi:hypothetical protein
LHDFKLVSNYSRKEKELAALAAITGKPVLDVKKKEAEIKEMEKKEIERKPEKEAFDPLVWTRVPFGGVINEFKQRAPLFKSDITDAFSPMCIAAIVFIFCSALSGAIAFGGLLGKIIYAYRVFHEIGHSKLDFRGLVFDLSQFSIMLKK